MVIADRNRICGFAGVGRGLLDWLDELFEMADLKRGHYRKIWDH